MRDSRCLIFAPVISVLELAMFWRGSVLTLWRGGIEWRGTRYEIEVERQGVAGALELWADGQRIAGNLLPLPPAGTARVQVRVILK